MTGSRWTQVRLDVGADGRIRIAGPVLFSGYRLRPDLTAEATDGPWFITSDLGSVSPAGLLTVRGRADDVITTGGEKVLAAEVEAALGTLPGVREAAVVGVPDPDWGEQVTAIVVAADPAAPPDLAADPRACAEHPGRDAAPAGAAWWLPGSRCCRPASRTGPRCVSWDPELATGTRQRHGNN